MIQYLHKLQDPGVRYEIGLSILTEGMVPINASKCAAYSDTENFKEDMKRFLDWNEFVVRDRKHSDVQFITSEDVIQSITIVNTVHKRGRAQQGAPNERLEYIDVLRHIFRHSITRHSF